MSSQRLVSAVFVLKYAKRFRSDGTYLGRAAHKITLGLLQQVSIELATELHNLNDRMPLTVSDLFQSNDEFHWMRVTGLREDVVNALHELTQLDNLNFDGWRVHYALIHMHDWSGETTIANLIEDSWHDSRNIKIEFQTPAVFKSKGLYRPLPLPDLTFKSLFSSWESLVEADENTVLPYTPTRQVLETFLNYAVSVRYYNVRAQHVQMKHNPIQAFSGNVHYNVEKPTRALQRAAQRNEPHTADVMTHYADLTCWLNLLTDFGFYSGVGAKTAQGLGMMRRM
ncbi:MAG: CRISPR system precrRNA processing endoribonuclease RAMP protein Cas6 [Chloroflexota bacterium]